MWIKVCGMTRLEDIHLAGKLGAMAVGFIFTPSPRQITPKAAEELTRRSNVPNTVGVFVNEKLERVREIKTRCRLNTLQLHGDETPEYCNQLSGRIIKAIRVRELSDLEQCRDYPGHTLFLLDAFDREHAGGTGKTISRRILDGIPDFSRIILAGGIGPDNARELVKTYQPFGIDVNSKVEKSPGIKDPEKLRLLFANLK